MVAFLPKSLLIAVAIQILSQAYKFFSHSFREHRLSWRHLATFGGMPSAHSAFVTALGTSIAVFEGPNSDLFGLAAVFGAIVIFDAYKLRGNVQKQAKALNLLQERYLKPEERVRVNEMVGHSFSEIVVGIVVGLVFALPSALFWR